MTENDQTHAQPPNLQASVYATQPTRMTVFWRTFLPWQLWRFFLINMRMFLLIRRSHETHLGYRQPEDAKRAKAA